MKSRRCLSNSIPSDSILAVRREPLIALNATSGVLLSSAAKSALGQRGGVCGDVVPVGCSPLRVAATGRCRICVIRRHRPAIGLSPLYPQWLTSRVLLDHLVLLGTSTPSASSVFTKVLPENQNKSLAASGKSLALVRPARATMRDVLRDRHGTWRGLRWTRQSQAHVRAGRKCAAYGEVVWSWRRDPGV